jgi:hypothetical protein
LSVYICFLSKSAFLIPLFLAMKVQSLEVSYFVLVPGIKLIYGLSNNRVCLDFAGKLKNQFHKKLINCISLIATEN